MIKPFLLDLDKEWKVLEKEPILLSIIGSTALFLQTDYERGTKDTDFLEVEEISEEVSKALLELGGKDSRLCCGYGRDDEFQRDRLGESDR